MLFPMRRGWGGQGGITSTLLETSGLKNIMSAMLKSWIIILKKEANPECLNAGNDQNRTD
jgi:hypothetical protein